MKQCKLWDSLYSKSLFWHRDTKTLPKICSAKDILELGVGTGKTLRAILRQKPRSVIAIDFSEEAIKKCKQGFDSAKVELVWKDFLDFESGKKFDVIICYYFLNSLALAQRKKAVSKMYKMLNEKGFVVFEDFAEGDFRDARKRKDGLNRHFFSEKEVRTLFKLFNVKRIETNSFNQVKSNPKAKRKIISGIIQKRTR